MQNRPLNEISIDYFLSSIIVNEEYINDFSICKLQDSESLNGRVHKMANSFAVIVVQNGILSLNIVNSHYTLSQGAFVCIPPYTTLYIDLSSLDINGYMITLSFICFARLKLPLILNNKRFVVKYCNLNFIDITFRKMDTIYILIKEELSSSDNFFVKEKLLNLVSIFYLEVLNIYSCIGAISGEINNSGNFCRKNKICNDFFLLINQYSRNDRTLKFYADKLCISSKYLSLLIKNVTGISASKWITDAVIYEAKRLLRDSENSIKEISYLLNFPSQSFFGKYFKKQVGLSPSDYIRSLIYC